MKTRIFAFLAVIVIVICAAVPPPAPMREWINSWTTNRGVLPVMGSNNLAITNRIAGPGGGTSWNFYGISPNTVSRLKDATDIANAIVTNAIASSNGNYVLKFNGPSDGQIATNLNVTNRIILGSAHLDGSNDAFNVNLPDINVLLELNQFGLSLRADDSIGSICTFSMNGGEVLNVDTNVQRVYFGNSYWTNLQFGLITPFAWDDLIGGYPYAVGMTWGRPGIPGVTGTIWSNIYSINFYGSNFVPQAATASRLAALDGQTNLTNSAFSDTTISGLTNAVAGLTNLITATNKYILANAGPGTNNSLTSVTNAPSLSNQVAATFIGLAGQATNITEWKSNGVSGPIVAFISRDGSFSNTASIKVGGAANFAGGGFAVDSTGNLVLSSGDSISWAGEAGLSSTASGDIGAFASGFNALNAFYFGKRDSNTHALVFANTPPGYIFRDGLKSSNCPVTVGTLTISNNFLPGSLGNLITVYYPSTSTTLFKLTTNGIVLGPSGGTITNILTGSATLDFASTTVGAVADLPITVTGAASGDVVEVGVPQASATGIIGSFSGFASNNTVFVRFTSTGTAQDPASGVFRVICTKF